jgi:hypothetical protein
MDEFKAYRTYLALRAHFTTDDYDIVKMKGRFKASRKAFDGLGKEFAFRRICKLYKDEEVINFMVANFISGNKWGGVFDMDAARQYQEYKKRRESLRYTFEQDLNRLSEEREGDLTIFGFEYGHHPLILKAYLRNSISIETLVIIDKLTGFTDFMLLDDTVWNDVKRLIKKYRPFVKFDKEQYQKLFDNYALGR